jgi:hypothetical protein
MKLLSLALALLLAAGCTRTSIKTPTWSMDRVSFFQRVEVPTMSIATNGTATLRGYRNDGGSEAAAAIAAAATAAAVKSLKP